MTRPEDNSNDFRDPSLRGSGMDEPFKTLLEAAIRAPSGDNCQPWRFVIDPESLRIALYVDETRDPSPMNAGQGMSRIAVGAALENVFQAAKAKGWSLVQEPATDAALAVLAITDFHPNDAESGPAIASRVTNRRRYDGRPASDELIRRLQQATPSLDGIRALWIYDRQRINALAKVMGHSDALMLSEPTMRRAFLDNVRFDLPANSEPEEYLPLGSLELAFADRTAFRFLRSVPDWVLRMGWARRKFAAAARRLVLSASGLCVIVTANNSPENDLMIGRTLQRAWLALTANGLAAQPMMSVAIMENILHNASPGLLQSVGRERAEAVVTDYRSLVPESAANRIAFIMRFGHAQPPTCRTGRLPPAARAVQLQGANGWADLPFPNTASWSNCHGPATPV
jgi:hypothetical protein